MAAHFWTFYITIWLPVASQCQQMPCLYIALKFVILLLNTAKQNYNINQAGEAAQVNLHWALVENRPLAEPNGRALLPAAYFSPHVL